MSACKLHTETLPGNLHAAAHEINRRGLADYVLQMEVVGFYTIAVFKMPTALVHKLRAEDRAFTGAIDFDDPPARPA